MSCTLFCWSSLRVDYERIKAVGPDRAAAEWLLRCGAKVRFQGFERWQHDYNALPTGPLGRYKIQAIDATESCIMYRGFDHLGQCYSVENIEFLSLWIVPLSFPFPSICDVLNVLPLHTHRLISHQKTHFPRLHISGASLRFLDCIQAVCPQSVSASFSWIITGT